MKLYSFVFSFICLINLIFAGKDSKSKNSKKKYSPIMFYTSKTLDSTHLIRTLLVLSSLPFNEFRFKKNSTSMKEMFSSIIESGFLNPTIPMISDDEYSVKNLSQDEAIVHYLILSYYGELFQKSVPDHAISLQIGSTVRSYISKVSGLLDLSDSLKCEELLEIENINVTLRLVNDRFTDTEYKFFYGGKYSYIDTAIYTLILFIENISSGCIISNFDGLRSFSKEFSSIPQISKFEKSSYFLSLLIPGTKEFVKPIDFVTQSRSLKELEN
ncbi:hypothetical protein RS030_111864 [Cryptosporidium xiaoi]|uniref:Glutathione S-transferase C-terminal domain-containing protein n=1 Tax=Cryptosporidium xiaoi TaxID=659607 RepID=A0AAV9Y2T8_9CRYT